MAGKLVLQIYENEVPLTLMGTAKVIMGLKDEHIREVANSTSGKVQLPKYCDNKEHHHYNACIGGAICLAKKYKRLFSFVDIVCNSCSSHVIVETLNYIFNEYYEGRYRAEWRKTRKGRSEFTDKKAKVSKKRAKKLTEPEPIQAPPEIKTESITKKDPPKKKERAARTKKEPKLPIEPSVPKTAAKVSVDRGKPRIKQGRPRKRTAEAA